MGLLAVSKIIKQEGVYKFLQEGVYTHLDFFILIKTHSSKLIPY